MISFSGNDSVIAEEEDADTVIDQGNGQVGGEAKKKEKKKTTTTTDKEDEDKVPVYGRSGKKKRFGALRRAFGLKD